nr:UvrD-like helicase, ATP-binding domain, P-loop containing nucleoside triphosphate hydrolase [Tanacetum cinerariifolium]
MNNQPTPSPSVERANIDSSKDPRSKEKRSTSSSKEASKSRHTSSGKSVHSEEPSHTVEDISKHQDQEYVMGETDEQPDEKEDTKADWFKKLERPPTLDSDWSKRHQIDFQPPQTWINQAAQTEEPLASYHEFNFTTFQPAQSTCKSLTELEYHLEECSKATAEKLAWNYPKHKPYPFNLRKPLPLIQDRRGRQIIPKDYFINKDLEYLKGGDSSRRYSTSVTKTKAASYDLKWIEDMVYYLWCPSVVKYDQYALYVISHWVTRLKIKRKYDYGYLEEIEFRRDDQQIYTFIEGDFSRLRLQDIEDMLFLLTQRRLTNLTVDKRYDLNVADRTAYTLHSDPHGIIYLDQSQRKRLMQTDELHKFSDGTLNDVHTALYDIDAGLRMEYLPMRRWSQLDRKRAQTLWGRPLAARKDHMIYHMMFSSFSQNLRVLPKDIPLDSIEVLGMIKRSKSEIKGKVPTEMELILEQTQQGTSHEVSVSTKGVKELKRNVRIKGVKKEALHTLKAETGSIHMLSEILSCCLVLKIAVIDPVTQCTTLL